MFDRLVHADWGVAADKRWAASAERHGEGWCIAAPRAVGPTEAFVDDAFADPARRVLLGFDFPIGVPRAYGVKTGLLDFVAFLSRLGDSDWRDVFEVADAPAEISVRRPFYPAKPRKGVSRADLVAGLGVGAFDDLLRACDRRTADGRAACAVFWTLGGNQVGKGALAGWRDVIRPALARGAALWPFDGDLATLAQAPGVVIAETYPADAYRMVGAAFGSRESKRRQADRRAKASAILAWAERHGVLFAEDAHRPLTDGFGATASGEDRFDALLGLLKMIEVADGRRAERLARHDTTDAWEGWILGR